MIALRSQLPAAFDDLIKCRKFAHLTKFQIRYVSVDRKTAVEQMVYDALKQRSDLSLYNKLRPRIMADDTSGHAYRCDFIFNGVTYTYIGSGNCVQERWNSRLGLPQLCALYERNVVEAGGLIRYAPLAVLSSKSAKLLESRLIKATGRDLVNV